MAPPHVPNIAVEPFEEVGDDKGLRFKFLQGTGFEDEMAGR